MGLTRFFPYSAVTALIYGSLDVAGGFYRIPATFVTSHGYGGMMVATIPFLIGIWDQSVNGKIRLLALLGTAAALIGVLLSATRLNFAIGVVLVGVAIWNGRMKASRRAVFALLIVGMMVLALKNERLTRFKSLSDSDYVEERISGSVNRGFLEILIEYPLGNGLGGGGTSIPYFLQGLVRNPISMENEYARILSEQGVIGLLLWIGFLVWFFSRFKAVFGKGPWATGRRLILVLTISELITGLIGTGMLTAIPGTAMLLLGIGFVATPMRSEATEKRRLGATPALVPQRGYRPVPSL